MASTVGPPRGMRDFLPQSKRLRDELVRTISERYQRHGFEPIETPALEDFETLHSGLGGDNEKLSFQVLRRGLGVEDLRAASQPDELTDLGLRFDLTVPLARYIASHRNELPQVFRALHIAPVWRAERPQKGRFRQFVQCDIDIIGDPSSLAEREVLLATADALGALGVDHYRFRVNDRRALTEILTGWGVAPDDHASVLITIDKLDKVGIDGVVDELTARHGNRFDIGAVASFLHRASEPIELDATTIRDTLSVSGEVADQLVSWATDVAAQIGPEHVVFDPTLVRGMGYYTGSIVELVHPELGVSLGGGGRYDNMIGRFLGENVAAFGFSLGFERLLDVVGELPGRVEPTRAVIYHPTTPVAKLVALKVALVSAGHRVTLVAARKNRKALYTELSQQGVVEVVEVESEIPDMSGLTWRPLEGSSR